MPSLLTILGLIMYLRFGWVLGNLGIGLTILVVVMATSITFITGLSASSIATNMLVGTGGEYFMISRSLGLELGGAIGIPLYFCRTLSITFYCFGLAEAIVIFLPDLGISPGVLVQLIAGLIIVLITILSGRSASMVLKVQVPLLILVGLSLLALIIGVATGGIHSPEFEPTYRTAPQGFWYVFAVFFPAVTGFTAGIGLSGDLKNPQKSIPRGTLGAILTGLAIYLLIPIFLSISMKTSPEELANSGVDSWTNIAFLGSIFVFPAIWGAILSSAFGSVLGGPRVLQALSNDGLVPKVFGKLSKTGQPTIATWVSGGIALLAVLLGGLNTVAQFVSILFLTLYVMVNLSAVFEKFVGDPFFRPTLRVPWWISLLGAFGALFVMFLISPVACLFAILFELLLYYFLSRRKLQKVWGDARAGFWFVLARFALLRHRPHGRKPRSWRPSIMVFSGDTGKRLNLVRLACRFSYRSGVVTANKIILGDLANENHDPVAERKQMRQDIQDAGLSAFSEVSVVKEFEHGVIDIAQANGIAGFKSNTILLGWSEKEDRMVSYLRIMKAISKKSVSTIIAKLNWRHVPGTQRRIDLWWGGQQRNGDLMLLLAHQLRSQDPFRDALITVRSVVESEEEKLRIEESYQKSIPKTRIKVNVDVVCRVMGKEVRELITELSSDADIVFLGLRIPASGSELEYVHTLRTLSEGLNTTVFVYNAEATIPVLLSLEVG